jgi:mannose-6-phosphate isomerase-like protein (cupin superfamily)
MQTVAQPHAFAQAEGTAIWFLDTLAIIKSSSSLNGGSLSLIEQLVPPGDSPYHVHHNEDEGFYILDGEMTVFCGERVWRGGPGAFVFLPRGIPHGFRVEGERPARFLLLTTPGGFEQFIIEAGEPAKAPTLPPPGPLDFEKLMVIAPKYNMEILGPLPDD